MFSDDPVAMARRLAVSRARRASTWSIWTALSRGGPPRPRSSATSRGAVSIPVEVGGGLRVARAHRDRARGGRALGHRRHPRRARPRLPRRGVPTLRRPDHRGGGRVGRAGGGGRLDPRARSGSGGPGPRRGRGGRLHDHLHGHRAGRHPERAQCLEHRGGGPRRRNSGVRLRRGGLARAISASSPVSRGGRRDGGPRALHGRVDSERCARPRAG